MVQTIDKKIEGERTAEETPFENVLGKSYIGKAASETVPTLHIVGKSANVKLSPAEQTLLGSYIGLEGIDYSCGTCNNCGSGDCNSCCGSSDD